MYNNFKGLKYFKPTNTTDKWGDPNKLSASALSKLDMLRQIIKRPVHVTSAYRKGNGTSQHHYGKAFDIIVPNINLVDLIIAAERAGFTGIGIYPYWQLEGLMYGGLHVDDRGFYARWMGVPKREGKGQEYIEYSFNNLKFHGVLD